MDLERFNEQSQIFLMISGNINNKKNTSEERKGEKQVTYGGLNFFAWPLSLLNKNLWSIPDTFLISLLHLFSIGGY